ncbi:MAG: Abi-alpha family protein [Treponema sp.]|jgi:hypothetical protein|nr:Abi-alpha family protein [Treponema sp.]
MFGEEPAKIASDNEITVNPSLVHNEVYFEGIDKVIALFFPSIRKEFLLRMRAETIDKVSNIAYMRAMNENIPIKPIPPKIAMPLIEKMSLEHEPDMYEKWASLLIAAGAKPNPIHQQYADIIANLNDKSAKLLKEIYTKQTDPYYESNFDEYLDKLRFHDLYKEAESEARKENDEVAEYSRSILSYASFHNDFHFPLFISGIKEEYHTLLLLEKLDLIKFKEFITARETMQRDTYVKHYGLLLTKFGYSFVDCLEHPTK